MTVNGQRERLKVWNQINWRQTIKVVKNLRQRIFRATETGNFLKLRSLQKLIKPSFKRLEVRLELHELETLMRSS